jgi:signal transduction histidine kinase
MDNENTLKNKIINNKYYRSFKVRLSVVMLLIGVISIVVLGLGVVGIYRTRAIKVRTQDFYNQMTILSYQLLTEEYFANPYSEGVEAKVELYSDLYDGRVMIIDNNFVVIKDSYNSYTGKYFIAPEVLNASKGNPTSKFKDGYIIITVPVVAGSDNPSNIQGMIYAGLSIKQIDTTTAILDRSMLVIGAFLMIGVIIASATVPTALFRPFNRLIDSVNALKEGFSNKRVEADYYEETKDISDAFNDVVDRMKAVDDSRQEFVSNVSHELKTPLASVKVLAESLNTGENVPIEMYQEFMGDIIEEVDRETNIINDLLSLVKLDKSSPDINVELTGINIMIEKIFKRLSPLASQKGVDMIFESERDVKAWIDEIKITRALEDIIENAIKYNHEGGFVKVSLDADHQYFTVTIEDSGIGIAEEDLKHIFERFYRADKSHSATIEGTGLGLAISRSAIYMHNGSVKVESEEGRGTTFVVTVPIRFIEDNTLEIPEESSEEMPEIIEEETKDEITEVTEAETEEDIEETIEETVEEAQKIEEE